MSIPMMTDLVYAITAILLAFVTLALTFIAIALQQVWGENKRQKAMRLAVIAHTARMNQKSSRDVDKAIADLEERLAEKRGALSVDESIAKVEDLMKYRKAHQIKKDPRDR